MKIHLPVRKDKLLTMPLFCRVNPLARPRLNKYRNGIYQPKDNQTELLLDLKNYINKNITGPIFVDCWMQFCPEKRFELNWHPVDKQFGDIDNLLKSIFDGMVTNKVFPDDRFIVGTDTRKAIGDDDFLFVNIWSADVIVEEINV